MRLALIFVLLTPLSPLYGQGSLNGYAVQGGDSTMMSAIGAETKLTFANGSETSVGAGVLSGHFYGGATESISYHGMNIKAGDLQQPFSLLTDVYSSGFPAMGVSASKGDKESRDIWTAFAGATSEQVTTPYFFGGRTSEATAAFFWLHKLSPNWTFQASEVVAEKQTSIEEIQFNPVLPTKTLTMALGGGVGSDSPFAACRVSYRDIHFNASANYTERSPSFHRIILPYQTVLENEGLNANGTFTSQYFGASLSHTTTVSNLSPTKTVESTGTSLGVNGTVSIFSVNASDYVGKTQGVTSTGQSASVSMASPWLSANASVYHTSLRTLSSGTVIEHLTQRISVSQFIEKHAVDLGGTVSGNTFSISGGYQMTYLPVTGMFQKTLVANIVIQLPSMNLNASTLTTPDGKTRYSIGSTKYGAGEDKQADVSGKFLYSGAVVDLDGRPVAGAAILLGEGKAQVEVFTAHDGVFRAPSQRNKTLPVVVALNDFMAAGRYRVVTCPLTMSATEHIQVVVSIVEP